MLLPIKLPTGMLKTSVVTDSAGRWYDGNLVRWQDGVLQPIGGWTVARASTGSGTRNAKPVRGMLGWRTSTTPYLRVAVGVYNKLFVYFADDSTFFDVTPAGLTAGTQHASAGGSPGNEAGRWTFDVWGENLLGCMYADGRIFMQSSVTPTTAAAECDATAPDKCSAIFVTPEKFVVALGVGGSNGSGYYRSPRGIIWSDQDDIAQWDYSLTTNQSGAFELPGSGWILNGKRANGESLIWTDIDLWSMKYVAGTDIYGFNRVGPGSGAASRSSMVMVDSKAIWMGRRDFYIYDGFTRKIDCPVGDWVFGRISLSQMSKISAVLNSDFGEITWYYPSGSSSTAECDSYVTFNYVTGDWYVGFVNRSDGIDRDFFDGPYLAGASGALYLHETGTTYAEEDASTVTPYVESGPIQHENGDQWFMVRDFVPDGKTTTGLSLTVYGRFRHTDTESTYGPFTLTNTQSVRLTARYVRLKFIQVTAGWRFGNPGLEIAPGGFR